MLRLLGLGCGALAVLALAAGCSSSSKPKTETTPVVIPATVLPSGTVVIGGTPVVGAEAATVVAAATAGIPLVQSRAATNAAKPGTPGAPARTTVTADGTVVAVGTPAPGATGTPASPTPFPPAASTPIAGATASVDVRATAVSVAPQDGFTLTIPPNPAGTFDIAANVTGAPTYNGFNVQLRFDPSVLNVSGADYGGVMGPPGQVFCPPPTITDGTAALGCTILGSPTTTNSGALAIFHFRVLRAGTTTIHFTTYAEGGSTGGTYVIAPATATRDVQPLTLPLHDATITVNP